MAEKKIYIGSFGPYLFDDTDPVEDADGEFPGELYHGLITNSQIIITEAPTDSNEVARLVELNEINLFRLHTIANGVSLIIGNNEQKLNHEMLTIEETGSLTINGSGELCVIGY